MDFDTRITNLEATISYLYNNFNPPSDIETEIIRKEIFDEVNLLIQETDQIKKHTNLLEDTINSIYNKRNINV